MRHNCVPRHFLAACLAFGSLFAFGSVLEAVEPVTATEGTVEKVDRTAKTVLVKAVDGSEHTFHLVGRTVVHGAHATHGGAAAAARDLRKDAEVVVHSTKVGTEETAEEIDHVGKDGLKASDGTITSFDRAAKTMTIKTADGTRETYRLTEHAAQDAGKDVAEGAKKSDKVTVYYSEQAGHKVAHFFKTTL
ncbi:MAG TPA: hypothetical protein VG206_26395 [Terriglobia bacterium]|nr:hypothetical protein [Terriglobia bacterium]